jgi:hypothetical protein
VAKGAEGAAGPAGPPGPGDLRARKAALLQWYRQDFPVGPFPQGIAFDGANLWVTNSASATVTRLRAADGADLGAFPVGIGPGSVAFDGANIWVASVTTVTKLRASDGANLGILNVGNGNRGIAFDGNYIWVAHPPQGFVSRLRISDGAHSGSFLVGSNPVALAFDGANIWVANANSSDVTKLRASDGATLGTFPVGSSFGAVPTGIAFDGIHVWVASRITDDVTRLRVATARCGTFHWRAVPRAWPSMAPTSGDDRRRRDRCERAMAPAWAPSPRDEPDWHAFDGANVGWRTPVAAPDEVLKLGGRASAARARPPASPSARLRSPFAGVRDAHRHGGQPVRAPLPADRPPP